MQPSTEVERTIAAMAAWEAALELRSSLPIIDKTWDFIGTCEMRGFIQRISVVLLEAWEKMTPIERDRIGCFDWEFIPRALRAIERHNEASPVLGFLVCQSADMLASDVRNGFGE